MVRTGVGRGWGSEKLSIAETSSKFSKEQHILVLIIKYFNGLFIIYLLFSNSFDKLHEINHKYKLSIRKTTYQLKNTIYKHINNTHGT